MQNSLHQSSAAERQRSTTGGNLPVSDFSDSSWAVVGHSPASDKAASSAFLLELLAAIGELKTTNEELLAINNSTRTLNQELANRVTELLRGNSARHQADAKTRWLSRMVESSNEAIVSFSPDGTIVSWNCGAERIFGHDARDAIGEALCIMAPAERSGECMELLAKLLDGGTVDQFETVGIRKDGKLIDVSISASVLKDEEGGILGAVANLQDITPRKKALEDLNQERTELEKKVDWRTAELRQKVRQLARMASELTQAEERERKRLAHVLHDQLQQVLVAAKMRIETLGSANDEQRKAETGELISLLDEALGNSRSLAVELSPPVLGEGLGKALEWLCGTWIKNKYDLTVRTRIDPSIDARQVCMRNLVFLAVKELLFNVVKHSGSQEAWVELTVHDSGNFQVIVRDHGRGFELNVPGDKGSLSSGLGLASVRERLEILGGSLVVHSRPGQGVEAIILAPLKSNSSPPSL